MKISILTQPLGHNYGGLLQAYALQAYLTSLGHETETIDRRAPDDQLKALSDHAINLARLMLGRIRSVPSNRKEKFIYQNLAAFRDQYMNMSQRICTEKELREYYRKRQFDAVIVGSDQVWRPKYSPCLPNFYLDFLAGVESPVKRISYAASFGVDEWEYTSEETRICKNLVKKFDALSVREESARVLCQMHFGVIPEWLIDPTLLLDAEDYQKLFSHESSKENYGKVLAYLLDPNKENQVVALRASKYLGVEKFSVKPDKGISDVPARRLSECQYPKVEEWLQGFADAGFVVTDSFHGCVFSIIFNKPFIAIGNRNRGLSRFQSLLSMFDLKERLIYEVGDLNDRVISEEIDWEIVNGNRLIQAEAARDFLLNSLNMEQDSD